MDIILRQYRNDTLKKYIKHRDIPIILLTMNVSKVIVEYLLVNLDINNSAKQNYNIYFILFFYIFLYFAFFIISVFLRIEKLHRIQSPFFEIYLF